MNKTKNILDQAMRLSPADKFLVIEALLNSIDEPNKTIDEIWAVEAESRLQAYKQGKLRTLSFEEVFGKED
ncbi:MAG: addiction module protein [Candidatus Zhuqueibacterota bacterium]